MRRIGIDVGGTNTDAALVDGQRVLATVKTPTTEDVTGGIREALEHLLAASGQAAREAEVVVIGTTHFVNAVVERRRLARVGVLRVCLPASASVRPLADWPPELREQVQGPAFLLPGGFELDGREIAPFDDERTVEAARHLREAGVRDLAISSACSPIRGEHEERAAELVHSVFPDATVTLSKDLGRLGLLERENVAVLNAALRPLAATTIEAFRGAIASSGLEARLLLSQNDGTVMSAETAQELPVLCFASGPTNSMRGAALLSGLEEAAVVDVGGTSTDVGILQAGFPREANTVVEVGGVRTLFRMPDVLSLALGGGTVVGEGPRLGPESVGNRLLDEARVFGGDTLTATDVAVACGLVELGDLRGAGVVEPPLREWFLAVTRSRLEAAIDRLKTRPDPLPLVAVGGGAFLVPDDLAGVSEVVRVPHHDAANAVGAALAQVGGEVDRVFTGVGREEAFAAAEELARARAVAAGAAEETLKLVELEDLPLTYMPGQSRRVRVRVAGELA